jgi:hypothetical protein
MPSPKTFYHSETMTWSSNPKKGQEFGKRNSVTIKNGKGKKIVETLNKSGKTLKTVKKTLKKSEIQNVLKGRFMKGFWNNCSPPGCLYTAAV